jgi:hypothetical protein
MKPPNKVLGSCALALCFATSAARAGPMPMNVDIDPPKILDSVVKAIQWITGHHAQNIQERINKSTPDLMLSLSALAAENDHLVGILKAMRTLKTFPDDPSVLQDISVTVREMQESLAKFTDTMEYINPDVATKPEVTDLLFTFKEDKRAMLNKLERFTDSGSGLMQSHKVDLQVLDDYIDGMSKIATSAKAAAAALARVKPSPPQSH